MDVTKTADWITYVHAAPDREDAESRMREAQDVGMINPDTPWATVFADAEREQPFDDAYWQELDDLYMAIGTQR